MCHAYVGVSAKGGLISSSRSISLPRKQPRGIMTSQHEPTRITLDAQAVGSHGEVRAALQELARAASYARIPRRVARGISLLRAKA